MSYLFQYIDEIYKCGKYFNDCINLLGFFLLSSTPEIKEKVNKQYRNGGVQGYRGEEINKLLTQMI